MSTAIKPADNGNELVRPKNNALPNSRRIYVHGNKPGVRVPFREIAQNQTRNFKSELEENSPVRVYDTEGPWGDPDQQCDVRAGLPTLRRAWIQERADVEQYSGRDIKPIDDGYLTFDAANVARLKDKGRLEEFPALVRTPLRAKTGRCVTQMHYARHGIITPEMEFIAIRENLGRDRAQDAAQDRRRLARNGSE